jgi:hypothetical protein
MNGTSVASAAPIGYITSNWSVVDIGDYNGDGRSDILWRDSVGNLAIWFMNGAQVESTAALGNVPLIWSVQSVNSE